MRFLMGMVLAVLLTCFAAAEETYREPARGTAECRALMDAIRPHAEWSLGAPVEFVVVALRVSGAVDFGELEPQRPGGAAIRPEETPMVLRGDDVPEYMDHLTMHVLYQLSGETWVAVHWSIGATDVWFSDPDLCATYRPVISEYCYLGQGRPQTGKATNPPL